MKYLFCILLLFGVYSCQNNYDTIPNNEFDRKILPEIDVFEIPLAGNASKSEAEISGLTWFNNQLILLPQFPRLYSNNGKGIIYSIRKQRILDFIEGRNSEPILPDEIIFNDNGIDERDGYESIIFIDTTVYITIESTTYFSTKGFITKGIFDTSQNEISIDTENIKEIESQSDIFNYTEEALIYHNKQIFSFHEANGLNINQNPVLHCFDTYLNKMNNISFPHLEYRITDATEVDSNGNFWVLNYLWQGDYSKLNPGPDSIAIKYGIGATQINSNTIERILKINIKNETVSFVNEMPVYLSIKKDESRNWEGIVKLDNKGFLIITDKFPRTIFGFVQFDLN